MKPTFLYYKRPDSKDCGPTSLLMIAKLWQANFFAGDPKPVKDDKIWEFSA